MAVTSNWTLRDERRRITTIFRSFLVKRAQVVHILSSRPRMNISAIVGLTLHLQYSGLCASSSRIHVILFSPLVSRRMLLIQIRSEAAPSGSFRLRLPNYLSNTSLTDGQAILHHQHVSVSCYDIHCSRHSLPCKICCINTQLAAAIDRKHGCYENPLSCSFLSFVHYFYEDERHYPHLTCTHVFGRKTSSYQPPAIRGRSPSHRHHCIWLRQYFSR